MCKKKLQGVCWWIPRFIFFGCECKQICSDTQKEAILRNLLDTSRLVSISFLYLFWDFLEVSMDLICMFFLRLPVYLFGPTAALSWNIHQAILDLVASWCCNTQQRWENPSHALFARQKHSTLNKFVGAAKTLVHSGSWKVNKRPLLSDEENTIIWNFSANSISSLFKISNPHLPSRNQKTLPPETPRNIHSLNPKKFHPKLKKEHHLYNHPSPWLDLWGFQNLYTQNFQGVKNAIPFSAVFSELILRVITLSDAHCWEIRNSQSRSISSGSSNMGSKCFCEMTRKVEETKIAINGKKTRRYLCIYINLFIYLFICLFIY